MRKPVAASHVENLPSEGRRAQGSSMEGNYFILRKIEQSSSAQSFVAIIATE
jgi:hypothetical protein